MKFTKFTIALTFVAFTALSLSAQRFLEPSESFSPKKISYLHMSDGTVQEVYLKSYKRVKGLIKEVKVEDKDGNKVKIAPEDIQFMYLPQSGFDKFAKDMDFLTDVQKWDNKEIDQAKVADGYIYFELAEVEVKKEKRKLMMQLLNPSFCSQIKVYHDPLASETTSVGLGGFTMAGGDDKSYYVSVRKGTAFNLEKKEYKEIFSKVFGFCTPLKEKYPDVRWADFAEHVYEHSQNCR